MAIPRRPLPQNLQSPLKKIHVQMPHEPLPTSREAVKLPEMKQKRGYLVYNKDFHPIQTKAYRMLGLTAPQIATLFGLTEQILFQWTHKHPEFRQAWEEGGDAADANVAVALHHRACGYTHRAVHISTAFVEGEWHEKVIEYDKHYPPETGAASRWLAMRQRQWRNVAADAEEQKAAVTVRIIGGLPEL